MVPPLKNPIALSKNLPALVGWGAVKEWSVSTDYSRQIKVSINLYLIVFNAV